MRRVSLPAVAILLFGSGTCALIYQVAWLRELRLVFGASTAATAAVLAIFMGGLGLGGALLGARADRNRNPLALYAWLELMISGAVAATPFLILGVKLVYAGLGGSMTMGLAGATVVRLLLSTAVLGAATFLMGGTLPAAVKAVETETDPGRRHLALLYGSNTLGAVTGAMVATFFLLEIFGTRNTLWLACLVNGLIGLSARALSRTLSEETEPVAAVDPTSEKGEAPPRFVLAAACVSGFVFFLMELVWYRMLSPLLGGSTYTFGLILAVALLGIGVVGGLYALRRQSFRPTLGLFAQTCGLEALVIALAFALGDRVAVFAALLHPLGVMGLDGKVLGWAMVTSVVVLPAALVAGFQFPLLVGLLGSGGREVGRHTGLAYAWNTAGAIGGSLAGGFLLVPHLTALGSWRLVVVLLACLGLAAAGLSLIRFQRVRSTVFSVGWAVGAVVLLLAPGPTAAWRQSPIGAGRIELQDKDQNEIQDWINSQRRTVVWEVDGIESSVGLSAVNGLAFILSGKVDGNAKWDAPTQVMLGMVAAAVHPNPRTAMVLGLGTGSSAGWLAAVDSIERVAVAEIEPGILEVARRCAPVNRDVMNSPKVEVKIADGREMLLTSSERYDLIASAPSNPYRAGIASLYTQEFYRAVARRLAPGGIFSQWVQAYEIDTQTVRTIWATLVSVFPSVEIWQTKTNDMLLVCSAEERQYSVPRLRARLATEPFRSALLDVWGAMDLEGFLAHYVARPSLALAVARQEAARGLNTDDRMLVEFGFARTVGKRKVFNLMDTHQVARARSEHRPPVAGGTVDWERVDDNRLMMSSLDRLKVPDVAASSEAQRHRVRACNAFLEGRMDAVLSQWSQQPRMPEYPLELGMVAEALADAGDEKSLQLLEVLDPVWPATAEAIRGRYQWRSGQPAQALEHLIRAFERLRSDPWPELLIMERALKLMPEIADLHPDRAEQLYRLVDVPFSVRVLEELRLQTLLELARRIDAAHGAAAVRQFEPHVPWNRLFLSYRLACYREVDDPRLARAERDLLDFDRQAPVLFSDSIR